MDSSERVRKGRRGAKDRVEKEANDRLVVA